MIDRFTSAQRRASRAWKGGGRSCSASQTLILHNHESGGHQCRNNLHHEGRHHFGGGDGLFWLPVLERPAQRLALTSRYKEDSATFWAGPGRRKKRLADLLVVLDRASLQPIRSHGSKTFLTCWFWLGFWKLGGKAC